MCGAKTSKEKKEMAVKEYPQILNAIYTFCESNNTQILDAAVKHFENNSKWVANLRSNEGDRIFRLELIIHDRKRCPKILAKRIQGQHLMAYNIIYETNGVVCFMYKSVGDINHFIVNQNLNTVTKKEMGLCDILADVMAGLNELQKMGLVLLQMTWENVDVVRDHKNTYHGKVGGLENLVRKRNSLALTDLAPLQHCPPEALSLNPFANANVCKAQVYVMGSMMLELLVNKYMSGKSFQAPKTDLSPGTAYDNILANSVNLSSTLSATNMSDKFHRILVHMLAIDPPNRCCLEEVVVMLHQH